MGKYFKTIALFIIVMLMFSSCLPEVKLPEEEVPSGVFTFIAEINGKTYGYEILYDGEDYTSLTEEEQKQYVKTMLVEKTQYKKNIIFKTEGVLPFEYFDTSGFSENIIYFTTGDQYDGYCYYSYDSEGGLFKKIIEAPSSNMAIMDANPSYGWVVTESQIIAVDLKAGKVENGLAYTYETGEFFFFSNSDTFERKITRLSKLSDGKTMLLTVEFYEIEDTEYPERNYFYQFNIENRMGYGPFGETAVN